MNNERILIDEIVRHTDCRARILITLAVVGIASDGQLARLCLEMSPLEGYYLRLSNQMDEKQREVLREAERMMKTEGYVGCEKEVQLPKQMGGGVVNAWYLTSKGVAAARLIDEYFTSYAVAGIPCGSKKDRIPHELAVTECFLKLVEKQTVCDFVPEPELKRRLMKRRYELLRQGVNPNCHPATMNEGTGDFKAILLPKDDRNGSRFEIEGEAAINYRRAQIEAKPDKMVWFVTSKMQKEMVLATKKEQIKAVWILQNVCQPFKPEKPTRATRKDKTNGVRRNKLERKVNELLRLRNGIYTGRAVACILKEDLGNVSRVLSRLNHEEIILSEEIKLTPARLRGRPNKLFWHTKSDDEISHKRADKIKALVISEVIVLLSEHEYRFVQYTERVRQAEFAPHDATKNGSIGVVIESPEISKSDLQKWIETANEGARNRNREVIVAVSTREKYEEIKEISANNTVFLVENKSIIRPINEVET